MRIAYGLLLILLGLTLGIRREHSSRYADQADDLADLLEDLRDAVPPLTSEILKVRISMTQTQDGIGAAQKNVSRLLEQMDLLAAQLGSDGELDVPSSVRVLHGLFQEKLALVDRLRADGSSLLQSTDSLLALERATVARPPDGLTDLIHFALIFERNGDPAPGSQLLKALERLAAARANARGEEAESLRQAEVHGRRILDLCPRDRANLQQLAARTVEPQIESLHPRISRLRDDAFRHATAYRDGLAVTSLVFVLSVGAFYYRDRRRALRLNQMNSELELRVNERTRQLTEREAETGAILEGSAEGILSVEENGTVRSLNPAAARMLGRSAGELSGKSIDSFVTPPWESVLKGGTQKRDGTGTRAGGETFPLEILANPVRLGERRFYSVILRDVTEIRRVEQLKNEFISTVSHELRTPLTSIRGALGLVSSGVLGPLSPQAQPMVDIATKNCERLVNLVSDILDIEKVASGKMVFQMRTLSLSGLVSQTVDAARGFADSLGVTLSVSSLAGDLLVLADSDRLVQVLTNLISNACKFSPKGGTVSVDLARREGKFRVSVIDRGPGIPDEFRSRIFQKFAQAGAGDGGQRKGTGLGLAISKALIERMGGAIGFDSTLGAGSTFFIDLNEERPAAPQASPSSSRPRLLVCEDEKDISEVLRGMLSQEGYDCDIAPTLKDARTFLASRTYAGMTLDLSLPDGNGVTLLKELRQNPATQELPIIVISANLEQNRKALSGNAFGLVDWLEKPIPQDRLEEVLRRTCSPAATKKPRVLHVEDDQDIIRIVKNLLSATAEVVHAATVLSAWEKLKAEDFDLLILDIGLPDGSGLELLPALKSSTGTPIPSLVFSAHEISPRTASTVTAALLKSKTSNEQFIQRVRSLLGRAATPSGVNV